MGNHCITLSQVEGVVFDLDDTLYPECEYAHSGFAAVGDWLRGRMECPCDPAQRLRELFAAGHRGQLFDELLAEWQCTQPPEFIPQMVGCYREHSPAIHLYEDARRAIDRWRGTFQLGLLTDGPLISQRKKIAVLGLERELSPIICTDAWGREFWKPHHRAFLEFERVWDLPGRACLYIADNAAKDFIAPNQRGWKSIQICRAAGEYCNIPPAPDGNPTIQVTSLDAIELMR